MVVLLSFASLMHVDLSPVVSVIKKDCISNRNDAVMYVGG